MGRIAFPTLQVSPLGLVRKKECEYCLIHHLSYPENASINHFIDSEQSSVKYSRRDDVAAIVDKFGRGTRQDRYQISF